MGAPCSTLEHEFWASGKEWVRVVVRATLANSVFGSPGSKPLQFVGEPGCEHSSLSRLRSVPVRDHSKSVQELPFPKLVRGDWVYGSSWLKFVEGSDCSSEWAWLGGRGQLEWEWSNLGPMREPWGGEDGVRVISGMAVCDR